MNATDHTKQMSMSFEQKLQQIEELQQQIGNYGKLEDAVLKKINYKFRLEWNYTSNSMEGNTLTKDETRSVMIGNITVNGKPIKDVLEMKGHDEVITTIMKIGKGELNISEKRIKEIHAGIMHEEDPEKKLLIGKWKETENYLYNYKNERFDFVAPADVPDRMHQLINWLGAEKDKINRETKDALHPVELALRFNLEYVTIHPFYDGNGRTSRILTNLILIAYGYPPLYIKENERATYYQYLADIQGYGGAPGVFYEYMADLIMRSQKIVLDAIAGKSIDEPGDLDKKLALLKNKLGYDNDNIIKIVYSDEIFEQISEKIVEPLILALDEKLKEFDAFFLSRNVLIDDGSIFNTSAGVFLDETYRRFIDNRHGINSFMGVAINQLKFKVSYNGLRYLNNRTNYNGGKLDFVFHKSAYEIKFTGATKSISKLYHQELSEGEINHIVETMGNSLFEIIESEIGDDKH